MIFHRLDEPVSEDWPVPGSRGFFQRSQKSQGDVRLRTEVLAFAAAIIVTLVVASLVAHVIGWGEGAASFLQLTTVLLSAAIGEFLGERIAIRAMVAR